MTHSGDRLMARPTGVASVSLRHWSGSLFSDITRIRSRIRKADRVCVFCAGFLTVLEIVVVKETSALLTRTVIILQSHDVGADVVGGVALGFAGVHV